MGYWDRMRLKQTVFSLPLFLFPFFTFLLSLFPCFLSLSNFFLAFRSGFIYFFPSYSLPCCLYSLVYFLYINFFPLCSFLFVSSHRFSLHYSPTGLTNNIASLHKVVLEWNQSADQWVALIYSCLQQPRHFGPTHRSPLLTALTIALPLFDYSIVCPLDQCRSDTATGPAQGQSYFNSLSIVLDHSSNTTTALVLVQTEVEFYGE